MDESWADVRALADRHLAAKFPDCRGEKIDGVDLVMVDADLHGCLSHFLGKPFKTDEFQLGILRSVTADLDRINGALPADWAPYFAEARDLAHLTIDQLEREGRI